MRKKRNKLNFGWDKNKQNFVDFFSDRKVTINLSQ